MKLRATQERQNTEVKMKGESLGSRLEFHIAEKKEN